MADQPAKPRRDPRSFDCVQDYLAYLGYKENALTHLFECPGLPPVSAEDIQKHSSPLQIARWLNREKDAT